DTKACWETLTNGYDPEIYEPLLTEPRKIDDVIDFTFTGRLFKNRRGYAFAEALGQLVEAEPALKDRVLVHILGGVSPEIRDRYREILTKYGINQMFEFAGDVSYQEAMRAQVHTDYLLLIVDTGATSDGVIPGKLFEYVAARRPIFALTDPGATKEIIEQAGIGRVVPAESVAECKAALRSILTSEVPRRLTRNEAYLSQFERKSISLRLARIFDSIATPNISDSTGDALRSIPSE
ncbi:MAG TPA: glycosyltransferase, partial [Gammaproteobacteria bacterium]|nr:glycosyltransferase [Gammaproteobacteria bacterium]